ncbi:MAG TPA: A24 family peptidase [Candidatus Norongarragalinales archaeon]|jgi:Flp pilus assembly protein protease CpaA|nr:A24 family peptidase [Candidatus Norongarragalinales archaeon]
MFSQLLPLSAAILLSVLAIRSDLETRRIPDALNFSAIALGVALSIFSRDMGALVLAAVFWLFAFAVYKMGVWGGGDAKFFTALSVLLVPADILSAMFAFVVSAVMIFAFSLAAGKARVSKRAVDVREGDVPSWFWSASGLNKQQALMVAGVGGSVKLVRTLPFAPFLVAGFFIVWSAAAAGLVLF